jgi:hypothetical protein
MFTISTVLYIEIKKLLINKLGQYIVIDISIN